MINKVILVGRLGQNPETRSTKDYKTFCNFTLATDSGYGENKKTEWHRITAFDKLGENCAKYLHKGSLVYVEGRITHDTWEKDGVKHSSDKIIASEVKFMSAKSDGAQTYNSQTGNYQPPKSDDTFEGDVIDDEIPF